MSLKEIATILGVAGNTIHGAIRKVEQDVQSDSNLNLRCAYVLWYCCWYSENSVFNFLCASWESTSNAGITPQNLWPVATSSDRRWFQQWLNEECPAIVEHVRQEDTQIHWDNEAAVVNTMYVAGITSSRCRLQWLMPQAGNGTNYP